MDYASALMSFKARESDDVENISPIMEDSSLRSAVVAWKSARIEFKEGVEDCADKEDNLIWEWLWEHVEVDLGHLATITNTKIQDMYCVFERMKGYRLIYPDGTINGMAKMYINKLIMKQIGSAKRGRPKKDSGGSKEN